MNVKDRGHGAQAAFDRLDHLALSDHSLQSVLGTVAELAKHVLPGELETSVSLLVPEGPSTVGATAELSVNLDARQYQNGDGPCLQAATTGQLVEMTDARSESRWGTYPRSAVEAGALSSLSVPLGGPEQIPAALNLYAREPEAFDDAGRSVARRFAEFAGVAVTYMNAYHSARDLADNLQAALASRAVIDQAKGILIERHRITADQAFEVLARTSMRTNTKLRALAAHLVETGELPEADGRS
jgi:GAF domain-containing protein